MIVLFGRFVLFIWIHNGSKIITLDYKLNKCSNLAKIICRQLLLLFFFLFVKLFLCFIRALHTLDSFLKKWHHPNRTEAALENIVMQCNLLGFCSCNAKVCGFLRMRVSSRARVLQNCWITKEINNWKIKLMRNFCAFYSSTIRSSFFLCTRTHNEREQNIYSTRNDSKSNLMKKVFHPKIVLSLFFSLCSVGVFFQQKKECFRSVR